MLECNGYKMFKGTMKLVSNTGRHIAFITDIWTYDPNKDLWYDNYGIAFPTNACIVFKDKDMICEV